MTVRLERFELTCGSYGQQYTTIDGRRCITFFDLRDPNLRGLQAGAKVEFEVAAAPTVLCNDPRVTEPLAAAKLLCPMRNY